MSGSPPLPPNTTSEAGDQGLSRGDYRVPGSQNAPQTDLGAPLHRIMSGLPPPPPMPPPQASTYQYGGSERAFAYRRPEESMPMAMPISSSYPLGTGQPSHPAPQLYAPMAGPAQGAGLNHLPSVPHHPYAAQMPPQSAEENQPFTSPKSQRKTKGHVASACVPCKKAHLRCDARRPCSRCLSNGKEDACVDVQHKKRGRPRLRDDREGRYGSSTYPQAQDAAMRRPMSVYSSSDPTSGYDDSIRRSQSYRVLKSQQSEPIAPRYLQRASSSDANIHAPSLTVASPVAEPVAYLNLNMEVVKTSPTFLDAIGIEHVRGRPVLDIVAPSDRAKLQGHQLSMQEERSKRDPVYLPPIFGKEQEQRVFDALRFDTEELSRIQLDRQDMLAFASADGQWRSFSVLMGSIKRESIYVIALVLSLPSGYPYPSPSPQARELSYAIPSQSAQGPFQLQLTQQHPTYAQHAPSANFEGSRKRVGESGLVPLIATGQQPPMMPGLSHGVSPGFSPGLGPGLLSYAPSASRPDHAMGPPASQVPRSEIPSVGRPPPHQSTYQLPPIRSSTGQETAQPEQTVKRDDRSSRVDIGGLIEKPENPRDPQ